MKGLANSIIKDVATNTATRTVVVDVSGLSAQQIENLQAIVSKSTSDGIKKIMYINGGGK